LDVARIDRPIRFQAAHVGLAIVAAVATALLAGLGPGEGHPKEVVHFHSQIQSLCALALAYFITVTVLELDYAFRPQSEVRRAFCTFLELAGHVIVLAASTLSLAKGPGSLALLLGLDRGLTLLLTVSAVGVVVALIELRRTLRQIPAGGNSRPSILAGVTSGAVAGIGLALACVLLYLELEPLPNRTRARGEVGSLGTQSATPRAARSAPRR